jgi:hypothetical protein
LVLESVNKAAAHFGWKEVRVVHGHLGEVVGIFELVEILRDCAIAAVHVELVVAHLHARTSYHLEGLPLVLLLTVNNFRYLILTLNLKPLE